MGAARAMSELDYFGPDGGRLAMAFAGGWATCLAFCLLVGRWLWGLIGKVKDDQIAAMKADAEEDRRRCADMETRLVARIQNLEGLLIMTSPGQFRNQVQQSISELRQDAEAAS